MRDRNFLVENNAKPIWHPMAHPAQMREQTAADHRER